MAGRLAYAATNCSRESGREERGVVWSAAGSERFLVDYDRGTASDEEEGDHEGSPRGTRIYI